MIGVAWHPFVHIGAESEFTVRALTVLFHFNGKKRRVIDTDADLLNRRHQKILVRLALEDRGKQLHQRRAADRRAEIEPRAVAGNPHIEIAAERRIPEVDRRQAFRRSPLRGLRQAVEALGRIRFLFLPLVRHCLP